MDRITTKEFIRVFKDIHKNSTDKKFCFILGAGASKSSGIPTGEEMSRIWYQELKETLEQESLEKWKTQHNIEESRLSSFYGLIYQKRFLHNYSSGYDFLNQSMKYAKPGFGYSVIAQLLSTTKNNIVITTNFDSLTEEALYRYSYKKFLVCGHESLTGFATPSAERPLIAKIHRDLLMNPQNRPDETSELAAGWKNALDNIFRTYIPVVIGYGGNDGSLMGYFEHIDSLENIFWCCMKNSKISQRIENLLKNRNGRLVETEGFDHLMYDICIAGELGFLNTTLLKVADETSKDYEKSVNEIIDSKSLEPGADKSNSEFSKMAKGETAFDYYLRISGEKSDEGKEKLFKKALQKFPDSVELNGYYAKFLQESRRNYKEADRYYKKALALDPSNARINGNYAIFLHRIKREYDIAEKYYIKSLEQNPNSAITNGNFAIYQNEVKKDLVKAEEYFQKALMIDPNNADNVENYALFCSDFKKDYHAADDFFKKALMLDSDDADFNENYGVFLCHIKHDCEEAEKYYRKALKTKPDDPQYTGNLAQLLLGLGKIKEGEKYLNKAFQNKNIHDGVLIELWFYKYCHFPESIETAKKKIENLLFKGVKSPNWNFTLNVQRAISNNHPDIETVKKFASEISGIE